MRFPAPAGMKESFVNSRSRRQFESLVCIGFLQRCPALVLCLFYLVLVALATQSGGLPLVAKVLAAQKDQEALKAGEVCFIPKRVYFPPARYLSLFFGRRGPESENCSQDSAAERA